MLCFSSFKENTGLLIVSVERHMLIVAVTFQRGYFLALSLNPVIYVHLVSGWWCKPCLCHLHCSWNASVYIPLFELNYFKLAGSWQQIQVSW